MSKPNEMSELGIARTPSPESEHIADEQTKIGERASASEQTKKRKRSQTL